MSAGTCLAPGQAQDTERHSQEPTPAQWRNLTTAGRAWNLQEQELSRSGNSPLFPDSTLPGPVQRMRGDVGSREVHAGFSLMVCVRTFTRLAVSMRGPEHLLADMEVPSLLWMAGLGRPDTIGMISVICGSVDVYNTGVGIAYRLNWKFWEKEVAVYDSETTGPPVFA